MQKLKYDVKEDTSLVDELKKYEMLKDKDINVFNANVYYKFIEALKNCKNCKSLEECKNPSKGYCYIVNEKNGNASLQAFECKYLKEKNKEYSKKEFLHSLYMPSGIQSATLDKYDTSTQNRKDAYKKAINFITKVKNKEKTPGLYLEGRFSTGKTYLLAAICNELSNYGVSSLIVYFPDLVRELKSLMFDKSLEDKINFLKTVDVLVLDDFGSEVLTSVFRDEILGPVLNYRFQENLPVCISTNLPVSMMFEHLAKATDEAKKNTSSAVSGGRLFSRIEKLAREKIDFTEEDIIN